VILRRPMLRPSPGRALAGSVYALLAGLSGACFDPVQAPNAYDAEVDLCAPVNAETYRARVQDCRLRWQQDHGSCAGVVSFSGTLQGVRVVVDADLEQTQVRNIQVNGVTYRDRLKMVGTSPYFQFELASKLVGGTEDVGVGIRTLAIHPAVDPQSTWYEDSRVDVELGLFAGTSGDIQLSSGELVLEEQTADESSGRLHGKSLDGESELSGCFHAFTTEMILERESP
jgi:hypothetical protein